MIALGPAVTVVNILIMQEQFTIGIESCGKGPGPGYAGVIVRSVPRADRSVDVGISGVRAEFALNERGELAVHFNGEERLG